MTAKKASARTETTKTRRAAAAKRRAARSRKPAAGTSAAKRRAVSRRAPAIPPILLEGDEPAMPGPSGPGQKFALGPTPPSQEFAGESAELPEAYGTKQLHLTARDPHWLYANWDLTREQQLHCNRQSVDGHLILRIYVDAPTGKPILEIHVHPESRHWFANVQQAGAKYAAEIGFYRKNRRWSSVATSGTALTPSQTVSPEASEEFATIPVDVPFEKLVALVAQVAHEQRALAQTLEALREAGHPDLPRLAAMPIGPWTPEQERALAAIINVDQVQRVWIGSLEVTEMVRRQLEREISSLGAAQFGWPSSPGGAVSSVSSPFGAEQRPAKGFWFNVNAELIIYGATEPDASVSIGGRRIKLRADGSFAYRFALPDGEYDLPVVAVSADQTDGRAADLKFTRSTEYLGDVGAHPQDPALKQPTPDNV